MDHFKQIYTRQAAAYHRMIAFEDVDANLLRALEQVIPLAGKRILDLGTGTGRIPLLLSQQSPTLIGLDLHADMLREHKQQRYQVGGQWDLVQGDIRTLPFPRGWAEIITAGWAIGHSRSWYADEWQVQIGQMLQEMHRVVAPGGALIILETLTTGSLNPAPPSQGLAEYYAWLEKKWGFSRQEVSTDFQFANVDDAVAKTKFFFGEELSTAIKQHGWSRLPEWTGVWSKRV
jgi:ubiquinone/menaquinone biosynthesis C-methylase UbiE